ncbi:MAG TPA: hypothetical protein VNS63_16960 [Blastocatellia bacterium]|nr:hypothetical protein [Blastocatellia bacterium]
MPKPVIEQTTDREAQSGAMMAELFEAVGFEIADEDSYNLLVEDVEFNGHRSRVERGDAALDGRCWKLGDGLEVWSVLYEHGAEAYYADCRPAFRSRYVRVVLPWELTEYQEDGEAVVRGTLQGGPEVIFELQNMTELDQRVFREPHLRVALAGIAYSARVHQGGSKREAEATPGFQLAERITEFAEQACENDYIVSGRVLAWRDLQNPATAAALVWIYVDAGKLRVEVLASRAALAGRLSIGATITANIWLQGHVLEEADITARYEGVDPSYETGDFWLRLRREN